MLWWLIIIKESCWTLGTLLVWSGLAWAVPSLGRQDDGFVFSGQAAALRGYPSPPWLPLPTCSQRDSLTAVLPCFLPMTVESAERESGTVKGQSQWRRQVGMERTHASPPHPLRPPPVSFNHAGRIGGGWQLRRGRKEGRRQGARSREAEARSSFSAMTNSQPKQSRGKKPCQVTPTLSGYSSCLAAIT